VSDVGAPIERMLRWLDASHIGDPELKAIIALYDRLGREVCDAVPSGPERTVALRKLVESKDCAVRAVLDARPNRGLST
jgi:hypothetical protein